MKVNFTEREYEIQIADDLSEFTDAELGAFYRKDFQRLKEMTSGEFKQEKRISQASMVSNILGTFVDDCKRLSVSAVSWRRKMEAKKLQKEFEKLEASIYPLFRRLDYAANWKKDID